MRARTTREPVVAGVSVSLTGPLSRQGHDAYDGIRLWVDHVASAGGLALGGTRSARPLRLVALDDASRAPRARENVGRLLAAERVDLLLGPYGSGATLAVVPLAAEHRKILWNHGGASDAIHEAGPLHVVSVLSPASAYLRDLPALARRRTRARRAVVLYARRGTFGSMVRGGVEAGAGEAGFDSVRAIPFDAPLRDVDAFVASALADRPDLVVAAGPFGDDVAIARARHRLGTRATFACVGAGAPAFHQELGVLAEGVIGPSQWEPDVYEHPTLGPPSDRFCAEFRRAYHRDPSYVAAQAYALGIVIGECIRRAHRIEDQELLAAARALDATTLYGRFRLDPNTLRQVGHEIMLVEWRDARKHRLPAI